MRNHSTLVLIVLLLSLHFSLGAQNRNAPVQNAIIKGQIIDGDSSNPLDYATITLFSSSDSSMVTGTVTDESGTFTIEAQPGTYYAVIDFISYQTKTINDITLSPSNRMADLGVIQMAQSSTMLEEIEVRAEKSQMQLSLDKRVFNVGKDLANIGGSAADILDNVPSVSVDIEGSVSLRGSQNLRILVDGRPSGLVGVENANGLRSLPANMIDRIEVITNPSARYEAEGMAGIINIILKKTKKQGLNGSFDVNVGYPQQYGTAINLNYRRKNFNLFANYGLSYRQSPGSGSLYQEFYRNDTTFIQSNTRERERTGLSNSIRFGSDYFINDKNTLTASFLYRGSDEENFGKLTYRDYLFNTDNPTGITTRTDDEFEDEFELEYALNYKRTFNKKGQELKALIRYEDNTETEGSDLQESFFDAENVSTGEPNLQQRSNNREGDRNYLFQLDYVHPFKEEGKFEIGYRGSLRDIKNDFLVEELNNQLWSPIDGFSNNLIYDENIHALYLILGNKINKFSYQLGLRGELSDVRTELVQTSEVNDRTYSNLFPTAHFTYELPDQNSVQISYSRRLRRPRFRELNPFFTYNDARNIYGGNPDLDPEFTDSYELGHIKYWGSASFSSSIYYRHTEGVVERIRTVNDEGITRTRPVNLSTQDAYGFEFNFSVEPTKWWRLSGDMNFYRAITEGLYEGITYDADTYTMNGRFTSRTTIKKEVDIQIRGNYRAPRQTTQGSSRAYIFFDLGANKDILKGKGTITFSIRDILNSRKWRYTSFGEDFYSEGDFQWRARQFTLSLNYRLNQKKQRGNRGQRGERGGGDDMGF
jgi:outer membrane receptor protein involved in Fe transport